MNPQEQKERREWWYLSRFRETCHNFPPGKVRRGVHPEPDFIVETASGDIVGMEVTELYHDGSGCSSKVRESEQTEAVRAACRQIEKAGVPPLDVAVYFAPEAPIAKRDRTVLASRIANVVLQRAPTIQETVTLENYFDGSFPESVLGIRISRLADLTRHHWSMPRAGYIRADFAEALQARITAKAKKQQKSYARACQRCWLLVVADGFGPSSLFDTSSPALSHVYKAPFERTFFEEAFTGCWFELQTRAAD